MVHQYPGIKAMVRAGTDGLHIPFPALIKVFTVMSYKGVDLPLQIGCLWALKNFFKNSSYSSAQFLMVLGLSEQSQILALSLRVKGKAFNFNSSISVAPSLKVVQTSSKSWIVCVWIFIFHTMKSWEQGHQIRPHCNILSRGYNA